MGVMIDIECFPNPNPGRNYVIRHIAEEFTSLCPKTGHPDFGDIVLTYIPDEVCVELKAYKLYLQDYRTKGIFYEAVTNKILEDLVEVCRPRFMRVETRWKGRGGIRSDITVEFCQKDYTGPIPA